MKLHYILSAAVAVITVISLPTLKVRAFAERGHEGDGGEYLVLIIGIVIALIILQDGWRMYKQIEEQCGEEESECKSEK